MRLSLHEFSLPLRHAFTTTHGTLAVQRNLLVGLHSEDGFVGYGEAASSRAYAASQPSVLIEALEKARPTIEGCRWESPEQLWEAVFPQIQEHRFALCALDEAAHDLWGKRHGQPLWKLWNLSLDALPISDYTIGIDPIDVMVAKMREFPDWPVYKIKLGTKHDLEVVGELRRHTDAVFRIDANTAWTAEQTIAYAPVLKELNVEFIEQPLKADDWEGMRQVMAECVLPVIADESCQVEEDVERCAGHFHGINIKLTKAGGLTPARRMVSTARELGLKVMAGCMCESTVGISAIAQLLPCLDFVDMDGAILLGDDIADGVCLDKGVPRLTEQPGLGFTLRASWRDKTAHRG